MLVDDPRIVSLRSLSQLTPGTLIELAIDDPTLAIVARMDGRLGYIAIEFDGLKWHSPAVHQHDQVFVVVFAGAKFEIEIESEFAPRHALGSSRSMLAVGKSIDGLATVVGQNIGEGQVQDRVFSLTTFEALPDQDYNELRFAYTWKLHARMKESLLENSSRQIFACPNDLTDGS
jgi:hypothetical protein